MVKRIYTEYQAGHGFKWIAEGLTRDGIRSPSAHDPERNKHRCGIDWSWNAVRVIIDNPRYTGRQVWNKQPKSEILIDVEDVALGYTTKQKRTDPAKWVWSEQAAHEALIDEKIWKQAQAMRATKGPFSERSSKRTQRGYALRGFMRCGICGRKMQGTWNNDRPHYRCRFLSEYAAANKVSHPKTVCLREDQIVPHLDNWLGKKFDPIALNSTVQKLEEAVRPDPVTPEEINARREITECDAKLARHRAAFEAGADPAVIAGWMKEVQAKKIAAEAKIAKPGRRMTRE